jgi:hypothetical protein
VGANEEGARFDGEVGAREDFVQGGRLRVDSVASRLCSSGSFWCERYFNRLGAFSVAYQFCSRAMDY